MSVVEILSRRKSRERRMVSRQRRREMKKARREGSQRREEPEEGSSTLAVSHRDLPSTARRGGWSLQEWLQQYWPTYFQEVKDRDSVTILSEADFEKDFLDKMETYLKSKGPAQKIPKSPSGSQRKRDLRATGAIPKKTFVAASRGQTNESSKNRSLRTVTLRRNDYRNVFSTNKAERKTKKLKVITIVKPKSFNENEGIVLKKMARKNGGHFPQQEDGKEGGHARNAKIFVVSKKREDLSNRRNETAIERKPRLVIAKSSKTESHRDRHPIVRKRRAPSPPAPPKEQQQRLRVILKGKEPSPDERFSSQIAEKAKELTQRYSQDHSATQADPRPPPRPQPGGGHPFPEDIGPSWRRFSAADMMAFAEVGARRSHEGGGSAGMRSGRQADAPRNAASGVRKEDERTRSHLESEHEAAPQQDGEARRSSLVTSPNEVASMTSGDSFFDIADDHVREKLAEIMCSTSLSDAPSRSRDPSDVPQPEDDSEDQSTPYDTKDDHFGSSQPDDTKSNDPSSSPNNGESFCESPFLLLHPGLGDGRSADTRFGASEEESTAGDPDKEQFASRTFLRRKTTPRPPHDQSEFRRAEACQGSASGLEVEPREFSNFPSNYTLARPKKYFTTFFGLSPDNRRTEGLQPSTTGFIHPQDPLASSDNHARVREAAACGISGEGPHSFTSYVLPGAQPLSSDSEATKCALPSADSLPDGAQTSECSRTGPLPPSPEQWDRDVESCFSSEDLLEGSHCRRRPDDEGILSDWAPVVDLSHDDSFLSFVRRYYKTSSRGEKDEGLGDQRRLASSDVGRGNLNEFLTEDIGLALSDVRRPQNVARVMSQGELDFGRPTRVSPAADYVNGSFLRRLGVRTRVARSSSFGGWGIRGHFKDVAALSAQLRDGPAAGAPLSLHGQHFHPDDPPAAASTKARGTFRGPRAPSRPLAGGEAPAFARRSLVSLLKTPGGPTSKGLPRARKTVAFSEIADDEDDHEYDTVESDSSLSSCEGLAPPRCPSRSHSCRLWHHPARRGSFGGFSPASFLRRRARSYESVVDARRGHGGHGYPAKSGIREYMQLREILEIQKVAWKKWKKEERERRRRAKKMLAMEASVQYSEILWPRQERGEDPRSASPRVHELHEARNPRLAVRDREEAAAASATPASDGALGLQEQRGFAAGRPGL
ncbi:hypothetical protein C7M84_008401 [Penaeus vannamei]|uniref:Uncharacterized protein n=1 Tax=Penaeus vannamei TaxID=6689 RepID=A0A3R7PPM5_PENVA|nr:hypothetical protein C7M84_008401 [Penaeus vannamei]